MGLGISTVRRLGVRKKIMKTTLHQEQSRMIATGLLNVHSSGLVSELCILNGEEVSLPIVGNTAISCVARTPPLDGLRLGDMELQATNAEEQFALDDRQ